MEINIHNYEAFMIDFLEGKLDASHCEALRSFLAVNPQLAEELEMVRDFPALCHGDETCPCKTDLILNESGLPGLSEKTIDLWLAASYEGDLNKALEQELTDFLNINPAFENNRKLISLTRLPNSIETFGAKSSLKRTQIPVVIDEGNLNDWLISQLEGLTSAFEDQAIQSFMEKHPSLAKEKALFEMTKLKADMTVVFEGKNALRRFVLPVITQRSAYRLITLAASFLLLFGIYQKGILFDPMVSPDINIAGYDWKSPSIPQIRQNQNQEFQVQSASPVTAYKRDLAPVLSSVGLHAAELPQIAALTEVPVELALRHERKPRVIYAGGETDPGGSPGSSTVTLQQYGALKLRQFAYGNEEPVSTNSKVSGWEIADAGLKGINKITKGDLRFERQFTPEGKLKSYRLGNDRYYLARQ